MTAPTKSYPVRPIFTGEDWMTPDTLTEQTVSSKTAAVRLLRAMGYRVLTVGGLVELTDELVNSDARGDETTRTVWAVTVHPDDQKADAART